MRALALLALGGCNALFGLEPAQVGDGDGGVGVDAVVGHDEDGDGVPDIVDVCPHVADDQADELEQEAGFEADGVGDACDPHPLGGGDRFVVFDAFTAAELDARWDQVGAVVADGRVVLTDATLTLASITWAEPVLENEEVHVVADVDLVEFLANVEDFVRLVSHYGVVDGIVSAYACDVSDQPADKAPGRVHLQKFAGAAVSTLGMTPLAQNMPSGSRTMSLIETFAAVDGTVTLACNDDPGGVAVTAGGSDLPALPQGQIGVRAYGTEVAVDWIVAIAGPAP